MSSITVDEFLDMALPDSCEWHLVHGTVVSVTHARFPHSRIQSNIHNLLLQLANRDKALIFSELPYQMSAHDSYRADVAVLTTEQSELTARAEGIVQGSPVLVVEVMSRSNLPYDVDELETQCFDKGCQMFWKVVIKHRRRLDFGTPDYSVRVGRVATNGYVREIYQIDDSIPLHLPGLEGRIPVSEIFAGVSS